jgi:hypothetical protein
MSIVSTLAEVRQRVALDAGNGILERHAVVAGVLQRVVRGAAARQHLACRTGDDHIAAAGALGVDELHVV